MKYKKTIAFIALAILASSAFVFSGCLKEKETINYKMTLEIWGVFDDSDVFAKINSDYARANKQIREIKYRKISSNLADYEKELFDAIAAGNGPDVFFFNSSWYSQHNNKIAPLAAPEQFISDYKNTFVDVATNDYVKNNQIYAMPLFCDTLALYYNKDLFNQAGIASPPKTWSEVVDITPLLTKIDSYGNINQSAIALGRSKSPGEINRSSDILTLMMLQNGAEIVDLNGRPKLDRETAARNALDFYVQFAQGSSKVYTWNSKMDYSVDSFRYGKTAMMINYAYWQQRLKDLDPKFNFEVAAVPQLDLNNKVNFSNYWGLAVVKNKELKSADSNGKINYTNEDRINEAWKYIQHVTAGTGADKNADPTKIYLEKTGKPAARRDLLQEQQKDTRLGVFANQTLTAKSWDQPEANAVEEIFNQMIDDVVSGRTTSYDALRAANSRVNNLVK